VRFLTLSFFVLSAPLSPHFSNNVFSSPIYFSFLVCFPVHAYRIMCFLALFLSFWVRFLALAYRIMCFLALSFSFSVPLSPHPLDSVLSSPISLFLSVLSKPRLPDNALSSPPSLCLCALIQDKAFSSPIFFFLWVHFLTLTLNIFRRIHHFLIWWVRYLSFLFLLYKTYHLKSLTRLSIVNSVKRRATVITYFLVIPQNFIPFSFF
jgi:hypothetical protein